MADDVIQGEELQYLPIKFLIDSGLLFEINRRVLHPLGLAMEVQVDDDGKYTVERLWDCRDDNEGIYYDDATFARALLKYHAYMEEQGIRALSLRAQGLGYLIQGEQ